MGWSPSKRGKPSRARHTTQQSTKDYDNEPESHRTTPNLCWREALLAGWGAYQDLCAGSRGSRAVHFVEIAGYDRKRVQGVLDSSGVSGRGSGRACCSVLQWHAKEAVTAFPGKVVKMDGHMPGDDGYSLN